MVDNDHPNLENETGKRTHENDGNVDDATDKNIWDALMAGNTKTRYQRKMHTPQMWQ
jgi:hypothetical protein